MITKALHLLAAGATGLLLFFGSLDMPPTGDATAPPNTHVSPHYIEEGFNETNVANIVTQVLADYRSFDTLGEVTVVFTGALAVLLILRGGAAARREDKEP